MVNAYDMFRVDYEEVEKFVEQRPGSYQGLKEEALLTSLEDFDAIFEALPESLSWIELGSGHGRGPLLFAHKYPERKSIGIEFEISRVRVSQKLKADYQLDNVHFIHADLLTCEIPIGDTYFFYFPTGLVLDRILHQLRQMKHSFRIVAIESHGDFLERLGKEKWLKPVKEIPLSSLRYKSSARVFEKMNAQVGSSLHDISFQERFLIIEETNGDKWIGESYGLEWNQNDEYQLITPPRSFKESQVKKVLELSLIDPQFHPALRLRRLGQLKIETSSGMKEGFIRKIYQEPSFKLEISSGQQLEWDEIKKIFWESTLCFDTSSGYVYYPHVV